MPPVRLDPFKMLFQLNTYADALTWQPELGTEVLIFDRDLNLVSRSTTEPWFYWHVANGYVNEAGEIVAELVNMPDWRINQRLREISTGSLQTGNRSTLSRLRIDPRTGKVLEQGEICAVSGEFPTVDPRTVGKSWRYTYLNVHKTDSNQQTEWFNAIARFDRHKDEIVINDLGAEFYPVEPLYAGDEIEPDRGWILTVVYDIKRDVSEVWILDAERIDAQPVCRLGLPTPIPLSFHGTWQPH